MPIVKISPEDFKAATEPDTGWYPANLVSFKAEVNKKKDNVNYVTEWDVHVADNDVRRKKNWISPKMKTWVNDFANLHYALTREVIDRTKPFDIDTDDYKPGTEIQIHLVADIFNGVPTTNIDNFLPPGVETPF